MSADKSALFTLAWRAFAPDAVQTAVVWEAEYRFNPTRRWRFDWALPERKIGVETDGGQWAAGGGRHNRDSDRDKLNHAAADGWVVFRFSTQQLESDPAACVGLVLKGLGYETQTP